MYALFDNPYCTRVELAQNIKKIHLINDLLYSSQDSAVSKHRLAHEILLVITYASNEGSHKPAYMLILTRAFTARTHKKGNG